MRSPDSFQARSSSGGAEPEPQTRSSFAPDARTASMTGLKSTVPGSKGMDLTWTPYRPAVPSSAPTPASARPSPAEWATATWAIEAERAKTSILSATRLAAGAARNRLPETWLPSKITGSAPEVERTGSRLPAGREAIASSAAVLSGPTTPAAPAATRPLKAGPAWSAELRSSATSSRTW